MQQPFSIISRKCSAFTSGEVSSLAAKQIRATLKTSNVRQYPLVSGEAGTIDQLVTATLGSFLEVEATSASGEQLIVPIGFAGDNGTVGVIEMAHIAKRPEYPLASPKSGKIKNFEFWGTTYGIGELMQDVLDEGAHSIFLAWDEPLARDAGFGMAQAIGVKFLDKNGKELDFKKATPFRDVASMDLSGKPFQFLTAKTYLLRSEGLLSPKRTQQVSVDDLVYEQELNRIAELACRDLGMKLPPLEVDYSGSCIEFGAKLFLNAEISDGSELALQLVDLQAKLAGSGGTAFFFADQLEDIASEKAPNSSKVVMQWLLQYNVPTIVITNDAAKAGVETRYRKKFPMIQAVHALVNVPLFFEPLAPNAPAAEQRRYFSARLEKLFTRIAEDSPLEI